MEGYGSIPHGSIRALISIRYGSILALRRGGGDVLGAHSGPARGVLARDVLAAAVRTEHSDDAAGGRQRGRVDRIKLHFW